MIDRNLQLAAVLVLLVVSGRAGAVAQNETVAVGTRIARGFVWFPNGGSMSEAQVYAVGSSLEPVTGRPYSAEEVAERAGRVTQTARLFRDPEGRLRAEVDITPAPGVAAVPLLHFIEIIDPVAGCRYVLDPASKTGHRSVWPPQTQVIHSPASDRPRPDRPDRLHSAPVPQTQVESLGTQIMEGLPAEGTRTTTNYPENPDKGFKQHFATWEHWNSPGLRIMLLAKSTDSRYSETVVRLFNVSQGAPDPSLFQVPDEYSLVDQ